MINKINKERRRSIYATPHDPATRTNGKEPGRTTLKKNMTGHKAELVQANHLNDKILNLIKNSKNTNKGHRRPGEMGGGIKEIKQRGRCLP
jgi:hypothetical protein